MSPIRPRWIFIWLLLFSIITTLKEAHGYRYGRNNWEPSAKMTNVVKMIGNENQIQWFRSFLRENSLGPVRRLPRQAVKQLPRVIAAIIEGKGVAFFSANPSLQRMFSAVISRLSRLNSHGGQIALPNVPPVLSCPGSISKYQDPGRKSTIVTWPPPTAFDVEDGIITHKIQQTGGGDPGSRFSGRDVITYRVFDRVGRKDTCSFEVSVELNTCPRPDLPHGGKKWSCSDSYNYGSVCTIECSDGFRIAQTHDRAPWNVASMKCRVDGTWDHMPRCNGITCPQPQLPHGGKKWNCSNSYNYGSVCTIECSDGFRVARTDDRAPLVDASINCQADKTWNHMPECIVDVRKILTSIDEIKKDCTVQLENNRKTFSSDTSTVRRNITSVIKDELLPIQTAIASLLNDTSAIKTRVKNIGLSTECPSSWTRFENSCYLLVAEKVSWRLAKFMCSQMDSFLVEIYSGKEIDFLVSLAGNKTSKLWTGANMGGTGVWYWSESKIEVELDIFKGDYPSSGSTIYCGILSLKTQSIENMNCGEDHKFVCRKFNLVPDE